VGDRIWNVIEVVVALALTVVICLVFDIKLLGGKYGVHGDGPTIFLALWFVIFLVRVKFLQKKPPEEKLPPEQIK
jgi:hypothetical protein